MAKKTTKAPSGLTITRNGKSWYIGWKLKEKYKSQSAQYRYYTTKWSKWKDFSKIKKTTTSTSVKLDNIAILECRVKATASGKKASAWATKTYTITTPPQPYITGAGLTSATSTNFTWETPVDNTKPGHFVNHHWDSILVENSNTADGGSASLTNYWKKPSNSGNPTQSSGNWHIRETGWSKPGYSYTRWFRIRSIGWRGKVSKWSYARHVYAIPEMAYNVSATRTKLDAGGFSVVAAWDSPYSEAKPIDTITIQYAKAYPIVDVDYPPVSSGEVKMSIDYPPGINWTSLPDVSGKSDNGNKRGMAFSDASDLEGDQCLFLRVNNKHDDFIKEGMPILVNNGLGKIIAPSVPAVSSGGSDRLYTVTVTRNTNLTNAAIAVYFRYSSQPDKARIIGIIQPNQTSTDCIIPEYPDGDEISFGVQTFVGNYTPWKAQSDTEPTFFTIEKLDSGVMMTSDIVWGEGVPLPPTNVALVRINDSTVQVGWKWSWRDANQAELSWADHEDAWESTDGPQTYIINNTNAGRWNIANLGIGTWYIRVRLLKTIGDSVTYGAYSATQIIKLSSSPDTPSLVLSSGVVSKTGSVTCYWAYVSTDGTAQKQGEVCEAFPEYEEIENPSGNPYEEVWYEIRNIYTLSIDPEVVSDKTYYERTGEGTDIDPYVYTELVNPEGNPSEEGWYELSASRYVRSFDTSIIEGKKYYRTTGAINYGDPIRSTNSAQHITLGAEEFGWLPGETHHLAVRVMSVSGESSAGWSAPVPVTIADEIEAKIVETSLIEKTIPIDEPDPETDEKVILALTSMPLTVRATGAGIGGSITWIIERSASYHLERPDESEYEGFEGETVFMKVQNGSDAIEINQDELIGILDDGAAYRIIAIVSDSYGQSDQDSVEFEVHWDHQAVMPSAEVEKDEENLITMITPIQPEGWSEGDVVDIYRLSVDPPELIVKGAEFGTKYVDPYPTLGEFGGHRIVYKTVNGDYITEDNETAWVDYNADEDDAYLHTLFGLVIDFDGNRLILPYNVSLSSSWSKDFTVTKYLGGSIQGDFNPAVERSDSANTVIPIEVEPENVELLRRLAVYPGLCHVRMPDGSSFTANVEVKDNREEKWTRRLSKVTLDIRACESSTEDGLTFEEWQRDQEES